MRNKLIINKMDIKEQHQNNSATNPIDVQTFSVHHLNAFHVSPGETDEENHKKDINTSK